jgi:predicted Rdx family selenoprotein
METTTLVALIAAAAALLGHVVKQHLDRRMDLRARKIPIYTELLEAIQVAVRELKTKGTVTLKPELSSKVVTWGSPSVVLAYAQIRMLLTSGGEPNTQDIKGALRALLTEIRKDLGHNDRNAGARYDELTAMLFFNDA